MTEIQNSGLKYYDFVIQTFPKNLEIVDKIQCENLQEFLFILENRYKVTLNNLIEVKTYVIKSRSARTRINYQLVGKYDQGALRSPIAVYRRNKNKRLSIDSG